MTLQSLGWIVGITLFAAFGFPLIGYAWEKRGVIAQLLHGSNGGVMSRTGRSAPRQNGDERRENHRVVADNNNGATPTNGVAMPATAFNVLLSNNDAAMLASDPKVAPVDVILWEGRADALAALVAAGALKVTETEAATLIYGVKPSGTSPRWKLVRAAVDAAKARRAPPRYQPLDDQRKPVLES